MKRLSQKAERTIKRLEMKEIVRQNRIISQENEHYYEKQLKK